MFWEILIAVILVIGIFTALNEARLKRAARKNKIRAVKSKQHTGSEELEKQHK